MLGQSQRLSIELEGSNIALRSDIARVKMSMDQTICRRKARGSSDELIIC